MLQDKRTYNPRPSLRQIYTTTVQSASNVNIVQKCDKIKLFYGIKQLYTDGLVGLVFIDILALESSAMLLYTVTLGLLVNTVC